MRSYAASGDIRVAGIGTPDPDGAQVSQPRPDDAAVARDYFRSVHGLLDSVDIASVERAVAALRAARESGSVVYVAGNGGSATAASHFATDLLKATRGSERPLRVLGLTENVALITALANDENYESVFVGQLESLLRRGDVLVVISASGNSPNVLRAVQLAKDRAATSLALVGFDGGALLREADIAIHVTSERGAYGPVEDVLLAIHHVIADCLARG